MEEKRLPASLPQIIKKLKEELRKAVEVENYEAAAELRDRLLILIKNKKII